MTTASLGPPLSESEAQALLGRTAKGDAVLMSESAVELFVEATNDRNDRYRSGTAPTLLVVAPAVRSLDALARSLGQSFAGILLVGHEVIAVRRPARGESLRATSTIMDVRATPFRAALQIRTCVHDRAGSEIAKMTTLAVTNRSGRHLRRLSQSGSTNGRSALAREVVVRPDAAAKFASAVGDLNPIHLDPAAARAVGLQRPVLHGMCLMGILAVVAREASGAEERVLEAIGLQFVRPVFPGDVVQCTFAVEQDTVIVGAATGKGAVVRNCWVRFAAAT